MPKHDAPLKIGKYEFKSRVFLGSARYPNLDTMLQALKISETEVVTVSMRRVSIASGTTENVFGLLQEHNYTILPNTAGCFTAQEAIKTSMMAREALDTDLIKLEVIADEQTLLPDSEELLEAAERLVREGFTVLPYTNDDPVLAQKLEDLGCAAVMPLAAPIGTGLGIRNPHNLALIVERAKVPIIVDAGLGTASHVAEAFEFGCDAVLLNSAVSRAQDPVRMAEAVKKAAEAGRLAYLAGRMEAKSCAESASPLTGRAWN